MINLGAYNFIGILNSEIRSWMNLPPQQSRLGRGRGAGSHLHCHFFYFSSGLDSATPHNSVVNRVSKIHYPLTSLGAVFFKNKNYKWNKPVFQMSKQTGSKKRSVFRTEFSYIFVRQKFLCKGRDVELNRRAPRLKRASFSTLTTVSPVATAQC